MYNVHVSHVCVAQMSQSQMGLLKTKQMKKLTFLWQLLRPHKSHRNGLVMTTSAWPTHIHTLHIPPMSIHCTYTVHVHVYHTPKPLTLHVYIKYMYTHTHTHTPPSYTTNANTPGCQQPTGPSPTANRHVLVPHSNKRKYSEFAISISIHDNMSTDTHTFPLPGSKATWVTTCLPLTHVHVNNPFPTWPTNTTIHVGPCGCWANAYYMYHLPLFTKFTVTTSNACIELRGLKPHHIHVGSTVWCNQGWWCDKACFNLGRWLCAVDESQTSPRMLSTPMHKMAEVFTSNCLSAFQLQSHKNQAHTHKLSHGHSLYCGQF